ncbi:hypothetical protein [Ruminococcus bromii]|uniref:hypothetical protein n=1 Tax=Ruminococcus bromii TaxID=40518 RepID=UPI003AB7B33F
MTLIGFRAVNAAVLISIHTFLAEGDSKKVENLYFTAVISIHTFLAEGDFARGKLVRRFNISIHTFLAEGDSFD